VKKLILVRHADSLSARALEKDINRSLSPKGFEQCALLANSIKLLNININHVIVSQSIRTQETCNSIEIHLDLALPKELDTKLYQNLSDEILELIENKLQIFETIMLIGHNPSLSKISSYYLDQNVVINTSGMIAINLKETANNKFTFDSLIHAHESIIF
jgi:phosphohistidine phosphatase